MIPAILFSGGWGVQGTFLVSKAREPFPQNPWERTGKEGICLNPWPLPKDLFQLDSLARATKPRKTVRGNIRILAFFSNICVFPQKNVDIMQKDYPLA